MSKLTLTWYCWLAVTITPVIGQNSNPLFEHLEFGQYAVGYQLIKAYDKVRAPLKEQLLLPEDQQVGRAVPIYLWYPAKETAEGRSMKFKDYLNEWAYELDFRIEKDQLNETAKQRFKEYHFDLADDKFEAYFSIGITTLAKREAPSADGKFPIVVFSHGSIDRWWIWGEYLASHGIAVIGTPNSGTHQKRHEMGISGLETQIRDAEFALSIVAEYDFIDSQSVFSAGSSYGSLTATGLASRKKNVKGVISLDGIIADPNEGELLRETSYMDYQLFTAPILHLNSGFNYSSNYIWMDKMKFADQYRVKFTDLRHSDYHFQGMADLFGVTWEGTEAKNPVEGFGWVTKLALAFIQGLTGDSNQLEYLRATPKENGIPEGMLESDFIASIGETYSASQMLAIVEEQGFDAVSKIYQKLKIDYVQPFSHMTFYEVGIMLHRYGLIEEEKVWFGYYLESYPKSVEAMYRIGRLEALTGDEKEGNSKLNKAKSMLPDDPYLSADRKTYLLSRIERFLR